MKHLNIEFFGFDFSGYQQYMTQIVGAVKLRAGRPGQFLNWIDLPQKQIGRDDHIYDLVARSKDATGANQIAYHGVGCCGQSLYRDKQYDVNASDDVGNG